MNKEYRQKMLLQLSVIATGIFLFFIAWRFDEIAGIVKQLLKILQPVIIGLVLAYLLYPSVRFFKRHLEKLLGRIIKKEKPRKKVSNFLAITIVFLIVGFSIYLLGRMILPELVTNVVGAVNQVPGQLRLLLAEITESLQTNQEILAKLNQYIAELQSWLQNWLLNDFLGQMNTVLTSVSVGILDALSLLGDFIIGIVVAVYALSSVESFKRQAKKLLYALVPEPKAGNLLHVVQKSNSIFSGFISGKIIDSAIIGVLCFICMHFMKMPYTALISVVVGVTNVIPFFGPYVGGVIGSILLLLVSPKQGLIFVVFVLILQQVDGNIIGPRILGDSTGLTPFWVMFAILVGGGAFGVAGMILGVPTMGVIYYLLGLFVNRRLKIRDIPEEVFAVSEQGINDRTGPPKEQAEPSKEA